jgi:hypothetical protein
MAHTVVMDTWPKYPLLHQLPLSCSADAEMSPKCWGRRPTQKRTHLNTLASSILVRAMIAVATNRPWQARPDRIAFSALVNSLSNQTSRDDTSGWERGLGERCGRMYGQTLHRSEREQGCFVPPATSGARSCLSSPASAAGDLIATSVLAVSESVRPQTILEAAGVQRLEVSGDNLSLPALSRLLLPLSLRVALPALATTTTSMMPRPGLHQHALRLAAA